MLTPPLNEVSLDGLGPEGRDAAATLLRLLPAGEARAWIAWLRRVETTKDSGRKLRRVARAKEMETLRDFLAELRYALVFDALGFTIICEPGGSTGGADFAVARADAAFNLEVHRFRPVSPQASSDLAPDGTLIHYGRGEKDVRRALYVTFEKFAQLAATEGVVALWSDDDGIEELEAELAVRELLEEARRGVRVIPPTISCILFASGDVRASGQQFYCHPLRGGPMPRWAEQIATVRFRI